jgi:mono/diheme cytochrome c family protein
MDDAYPDPTARNDAAVRQRSERIRVAPTHEFETVPPLGSYLSWSTIAAAGVILLSAAVTRCDRAVWSSGDAFLRDAPADLSRPFADTRSEARLRVAFREPSVDPTATSSAASGAAAPKAFDGIPEAMVSKARRFYAVRCASCHGDKGDGKGLAADMVKPKPRDFTDAEWQRAGEDTALGTAIVKGGAAVGKSYMMPASYDLRSKPDLVNALVRLVRSFGEQSQ